MPFQFGSKCIIKDLNVQQLRTLKDKKQHSPSDLFRIGQYYYAEFTKLSYHSNMKLAHQYYKLAADAGHPEAQYELAILISEKHKLLGLGNTYKTEYMHYLKKAAANNYTHAMVLLANHYFGGVDCERDYKKAFELYKSTSVIKIPQENGFVSEINLPPYYFTAVCYLHGLGTKANPTLAVTMLNIFLSKNMEMPEVLKTMGECCEKGIGTKKDHLEAIKHYRVAVVKENDPTNGKNIINDITRCLVSYIKEDDNPQLDEILEPPILEDYTQIIMNCEDPKVQNNFGWYYFKKVLASSPLLEERKRGEETKGLEENKRIAETESLLRNIERAFNAFQKASLEGNATAHNNLAWCYLNGFGTEVDTGTAIKLFKIGKGAGFGLSLSQKDYQCHFLESPLATTKNPKVLLNIAFCYLCGWGVPQNQEKGLQILEKITDRCSSNTTLCQEAELYVGICYLSNLGVEDYVKNNNAAVAFHQFKIAYDNHIPLGLTYYAFCHLYGLGIEKDQKKGLELLETAANTENEPIAQYYLAQFYERSKGRNHSRDFVFAKEMSSIEMNKEIIHLYQSAGDQGCAPALYRLAIIYLKGINVTPDKKKAFELFKQGSNLGHTDSLQAMVSFYHHGWAGIPKDPKMVFALSRHAALHGNADACFNLARCYEWGIGVEKNVVVAENCYRKALKLGIRRAEADIQRLQKDDSKDDNKGDKRDNGSDGKRDDKGGDKRDIGDKKDNVSCNKGSSNDGSGNGTSSHLLLSNPLKKKENIGSENKNACEKQEMVCTVKKRKRKKKK